MRRREVIWVSATLGVVLLGVSGYLVAPARLTAEEIDVADAVFRYQLEVEATGAEKHASSLTLRVRGRACPAALLRRFEGRPAVVTRWVWAGDREQIDLRISEIRRINEETAEVRATVGFGGEALSGSTYTLTKRSSTWSVTERKNIWIK